MITTGTQNKILPKTCFWLFSLMPKEVCKALDNGAKRYEACEAALSKTLARNSNT
jgi:hypothetical protein